MNGLDGAVVMNALRAATVSAPHPTKDPSAAKKAAVEFEAVFITQFFGEMFQELPTDGPFGGGQGEAIFRSLMIDEYGKQVSAQGGFGLADAVQRQLLRTQEANS